MNGTRLRAAATPIWRPVSGEPVLLYPEGLLRLNPTAYEVVARCDGKITVDQLLCSLGEEFEVDAGILRADVLECLAHLQQKQLLVLES